MTAQSRHRSTPRLTPYDNGTVAEPKPWQRDNRALYAAIDEGRYDDIGKVDFDNEESATVLTVRVTRAQDGHYCLHLNSFTDESIELVLSDGDTAVAMQGVDVHDV